MGSKINHKNVGHIPDWVADRQSATLSYDEVKKVIQEKEKELKEKEVELHKTIKNLQRDLKRQKSRIEVSFQDEIRHKDKLLKFYQDEVLKGNKYKELFFGEEEILFILHHIKNSKWDGDQLDNVFSVTLKLQDQLKLVTKR